MKFVRIIILLFSTSHSFCQLVNNDTLFINNNAVLFVNDNVINNKFYQNKGTNQITFEFINNNEFIGGDNLSKLILKQNWVNNGINYHNQMTTFFDGAEQIIKGSIPTSFYNIDLTGIGLKILQIDCNTQHLNLRDNEFATKQNTLHITNTNIDAIQYDLGFVSSLDSGRLERNIKKGSTYFFPLGSSDNILRKRIVKVSSSELDSNIYGVRLVNFYPEATECPINKTHSAVSSVQDNYYYHLYQKSSENAFISFEIDVEDNPYTSISQWKNNQWTMNTTSVKTSAFIECNEHNFNSRNFILSKEKNTLCIPNTFTPNQDGANDFFELVTLDVEFSQFEFFIYNRWGELIFNSSDQNFKWDGIYKNEYVKDGIYIWKLNYRMESDVEILSKQGTITVIK